ncbi:MAG TPA: hypothetical protein P5268_02845 [Candidatus Marinimicrobia bacterium]|nr:hypothetical protein [Candidatus Neomarinimicrobiota bacterium]HRS52268.1 hypothetical protein [Candidatus Neomarinimicrobiota bacterium]HRU91956.1 hypothetical protein [Candidatus Neomarinimicrobiota bacterium]
MLFCQEKGWLTAVVQHDTVTISHIQTERNCAARFVLEAEIAGTDILVIERDTSNTSA